MPPAIRRMLLGPTAAVLLAATVACAHTVSGSPVRAIPGIDDDSRSPVDVDAVLLEQTQMGAITGAGEDLTVIPSMDGKQPVDIVALAESAPEQCQWYFVETQTFGAEIEEFHKTTYQDPPEAALISQGAAGYRDATTARRAFDDLVGLIDRCGSTSSGALYVGDWTVTADGLQTRTSRCGRDYRVKSAVLVEITFCGYPSTVPDIVMTNVLAKVPG